MEGQVQVERPRSEAEPAEQDTQADPAWQGTMVEQAELEPTGAEQRTPTAEQTRQNPTRVEQRTTTV